MTITIMNNVTRLIAKCGALCFACNSGLVSDTSICLSVEDVWRIQQR
jgi:hypothetical protein